MAVGPDHDQKGQGPARVPSKSRGAPGRVELKSKPHRYLSLVKRTNPGGVFDHYRHGCVGHAE